MANQEFSLTREFVNEAVDLRGYSMRLAELAKQAGEPVSRPLSKAQVDRAVEVNGAETRLVIESLIAYLERLYREGRLPEDAGVPRW
jgi:hypothetical protein